MRAPFLLSLLAVTALLLEPPARAKDTLTVDLSADAATLDPQVQWDSESAAVYRN
ncbi:MAG: hypothetical protein JO326_15215, partial [Acetobacteraceae bacterium]|nr:hypothetical protein [Acetobacteraceae bacterium]